MNLNLSQVPHGLAEMNRRNRGEIERAPGLTLTALDPDFLCGEMPVDERTRQPAKAGRRSGSGGED